MTSALFLSRHGPEWAQLKDDLIAFLDANNIAHNADTLPMAVTVEQRKTLNESFTDRVAGFAHCRRLLNSISTDLFVVKSEEATFTTKPEEAYTPITEFPEMPAPRKPKMRKAK